MSISVVTVLLSMDVDQCGAHDACTVALVSISSVGTLLMVYSVSQYAQQQTHHGAGHHGWYMVHHGNSSIVIQSRH